MKYDLIHLNNQVYAVDKEAEIQIGDAFILGNTTADNHHIGVAKEEDVANINATKKNMQSPKLSEEVRDKVKVVKIIATTDKSLGLPLLPEIEDDIEKAARVQFELNDDIATAEKSLVARDAPERLQNFLFQGYLKVFEQGYKAAKAKKYTEEDMRKAWYTAIDYVQGRFGLIKSPNFVQFINLLNPLPKQVELEMEQSEQMTDTSAIGWAGTIRRPMKDVPVFLYPKIKDGFVIVKRWIY